MTIGSYIVLPVLLQWSLHVGDRSDIDVPFVVGHSTVNYFTSSQLSSCFCVQRNFSEIKRLYYLWRVRCKFRGKFDTILIYLNNNSFTPDANRLLASMLHQVYVLFCAMDHKYYHKAVDHSHNICLILAFRYIMPYCSLLTFTRSTAKQDG